MPGARHGLSSPPCLPSFRQRLSVSCLLTSSPLGWSSCARASRPPGHSKCPRSDPLPVTRTSRPHGPLAAQSLALKPNKKLFIYTPVYAAAQKPYFHVLGSSHLNKFALSATFPFVDYKAVRRADGWPCRMPQAGRMQSDPSGTETTDRCQDPRQCTPRPREGQKPQLLSAVSQLKAQPCQSWFQIPALQVPQVCILGTRACLRAYFFTYK